MYRGRLERDLALWVEQGLVARPAADAMLKELDGRDSSFSVGRVLTILAALLVSAAILLLVASNWEAIPRIVRVGALVALIWIFYGGAALLLARGARGVAAAFLLLGTITFGGALSLIGQMYHLSGDMTTVMIVWFAMAALAALAFRSGALTVLAGFLAWGYVVSVWDMFNFDWQPGPAMGIPAMALAVVALVYYTGASAARHLAYLMMMAWLVWFYFDHETVATAAALALVGAIGFAAAAVPVSPLYRFARTAGAAPAFYTCLLAVIGLFLLHLEYDDDVAARLLLGIATMIGAVAAITLCGRDNGAVRYLGYLVFAAEVLYLSFVTVGTIIGTSGLFLISGLLVGLAAWVVVRLERRLSRQTPEMQA